MRFTLQNFEDGPYIDCDGERVTISDTYGLAASNAMRPIMSMADVALDKAGKAATPETAKAALLAAVEHLRATVEAAEVVEVDRG